MEENSQAKIQRLKKRVDDYQFVERHSNEVKRQFIVGYLFAMPEEDETQIAAKCVDELSEEDLNSICSDINIIKDFRQHVKDLQREVRDL